MSLILYIALVAALPAVRPGEPRFGEVQLSTGIRMHYAEQGDGSGEPIILLHGYTDSWFSFSRVLAPLSHDRRVYALDLRGHGKTDKPASGYHMRDLAADVIAFMDAKSIVRATIVGQSMGGFVAQQVALAAPTRVSHLILASSATMPRRINGLNEFEQTVMALADPIPEQFVRDFQVSTLHLPVGDAFIDRAVAESRQLPAHVWREVFLGMRAAEPPVALGRSGIPTLVLRGEKDAYATADAQTELAALVHAKRQITYPNVGHAPQCEQPERFAKDILEFVR